MGVARVSTRDQNPQLQLDALEVSGYDTLVQEKEADKRGGLRPAWQELLPLPQPSDTLKFWKSDRWGRSAADVLATVNELRDRGVTIVSLAENFDLATREGRLMFGVLALAAEYELELRAERQADGIAAARRRQAEGQMLPGKKHIGRPAATGPAEVATLRDLIADGKTVTQAARILKIGRSTVTCPRCYTSQPAAHVSGQDLPPQRELGWAQRSAIEECQREKKLSWRQIGAVVSVAHDALYRQFASGGPVVTASPFYSKESRNNMMTITAWP